MKHQLSHSSQNKKNSLVMVLFLFQYGLVLPFNTLLDILFLQIPFTLGLILYVFKYSGFKFKRYVIVSIVFIIVVILLKSMSEMNISRRGFEIIFYFLVIGVSGIFIGSLNISFKYFFYYGYKIAIINFILIFYFPLIFLDSVNYMRFGYAILPSVLFFSHHIFFEKDKKLMYGFLFIISFALLFSFGARGTILSVFSYVFLSLFLSTEISVKAKLLFISFLCASVLNIKLLISSSLAFLLVHGYEPYALTKFYNFLNGSSTLAEGSSGRDELYELALDRMDDLPFFGWPLNSSYVDWGTDYYHNFFLDIIIGFGYVGVIVIVLFSMLIFYRYSAATNAYKHIFILIFSLFFFRLLVSSSFWQRPEFWVFFAVVLTRRTRTLKELSNA